MFILQRRLSYDHIRRADKRECFFHRSSGLEGSETIEVTLPVIAGSMQHDFIANNCARVCSFNCSMVNPYMEWLYYSGGEKITKNEQRVYLNEHNRMFEYVCSHGIVI